MLFLFWIKSDYWRFPMIDVKLLTLLKVYETGNYTRAAEQLSLTQPAVSQHIRSLEGEFKIKIFERVSNKLHITHEGETVLKYAKRILALVSNLRRELNNEKLQLCSLTIGITHTAESNAIAEATTPMQQKVIKSFDNDFLPRVGSTNCVMLLILGTDHSCK